MQAGARRGERLYNSRPRLTINQRQSRSINYEQAFRPVTGDQPKMLSVEEVRVES
jgi:hypothetical protein